MRTQEQLILGTLLGDGCITFSGSKKPRYRVNHSSKQEAYVWMKYNVIKDLVKSEPKIVPNLGYGKFSCRFETLSSDIILNYHNLCYSNNGKKKVTKEWLNKLTPEGLAYWYMDDGGLTGDTKGMRISTHSFTELEVDTIIWYLKEKYCIVCYKTHVKEKYWILQFDAENRNKFIRLIESYIIPEMGYKIDIPNLNDKECTICHVPFLTSHNNKLTCSDPCAHRLRNNRIHARQKRSRQEAKKAI